MYMSEMIEERQNSEKVQRHDLLSNLLAANDENLDVTNLTTSEIIGVFGTRFIRSDSNLNPFIFCEGNIYIFLLAGHEVGSVC